MRRLYLITSLLLIYCTEVWGNAYNSHLNHLLTLQKRALHLNVKAQKLDHTAPIALSFFLLHIHEIYKFKCVPLVYSILHKMINMSLSYVFSYVNKYTNCNLRNKNNIDIIKSKINAQKKSFVVSACILWQGYSLIRIKKRFATFLVLIENCESLFKLISCNSQFMRTFVPSCIKLL